MLRLLFLSLVSLVCLQATHASNSSIVTQLNNLDFKILFPGDVGYQDSTTVFNLRFEFSPAAIAFPSTPEQVSAVVKIGAQHNHQVVARSGGHSYIASSLGGKNGAIVVDMGSFNKIAIDPSSRTADIGPGNVIGDVSTVLSDAGRALPHGTCPLVGIGGHSGYGGWGFTSRMWGLLLDNILSLDVVLANGTITTISSTANSDLFWAFRGASGSFGIVTSINVQTFPCWECTRTFQNRMNSFLLYIVNIPEPPSATVFLYNWTLSAVDAANTITAYQHFVQTNVTNEYGSALAFQRGQSRGKVSANLVVTWYAPEETYNSSFSAFFQNVPAPEATFVLPGTYKDVLNFLEFATGPPAKHDTFYAKSLMVPEGSPMSSSACLALTTYLANEGFDADPNTNWLVEIELWGGTDSAINKVPLDATAFAHRSSIFTILFYLSHTGKSQYPQTGFSFADGMTNSIIKNSPHNWNYGAYPNYVDDKLQDWQNLYYGAHYPRLQKLKQKYDPQDILNFPRGIEGR